MARVAFVSRYPPLACGTAIFTDHLGRVAGDREIVALDGPDERPAYPIEVHHRIRVDERDEFSRVARTLASCVDVVSIQHDPAIWGPDEGEAVLDFVGALGVPSVVTFHDIPAVPSARQRAIALALLQGVGAAVVMSRAGLDLLHGAYGVEPGALEVIPHGVPDLPVVSPDVDGGVAAAIGLAGREIILTFGLIGPGKGCELVVDALPAIVAARPNACYVIVGATHPDVRRQDGEAYRRAVEGRARALGLDDHVRFVDRFVGRLELTRWLQAAWVVVAPTAARHPVVSGTIAYAMAAGRAIVSTPHPLAAELLGGNAGVVLAERSPAAMSEAVIELLNDAELRTTLGRVAHERSQAMVWSRVGSAYQQLFDRVAARDGAPAARRGTTTRRPARVRAR